MLNVSELLNAFWRAIAPDHHDPRKETSAQARHRLQHLERSGESVRGKIERAYVIDANAAPADADITDIAHQLAGEIIHYARPAHVQQHYGLSTDVLQQAMRDGIRDYLLIFRMQRELAAIPATRAGYEHYDSERARTSLLKIYANHLTNAAEARFIALGVSAFDAHFLNGLMIRTSLDVGRLQVSPNVHLTPAQPRPENDLQHVQQIDQLRNYWRNRVGELQGALEANEHYRL